MAKPWYESKLVIVGVLTTLAGLIPIAIELFKAEAISPFAVAAAIQGAIIVILRVWFTNQPIT